MAAQTTVDFIKAVGFDENGTARTVDFSYTITNATTGERQTNTITVPLLTITPVPFIRVGVVTLIH